MNLCDINHFKSAWNDMTFLWDINQFEWNGITEILPQRKIIGYAPF